MEQTTQIADDQVDATHALLRARASSNSRIVVVGDIHGCYGELMELLRLAGVIDDSGPTKRISDVKLVFLGDAVDEGADSKAVTHLLRGLKSENPGNVHILLGNHEVLLLRALDGDLDRLDFQTAWSWSSPGSRLERALVDAGAPRLSTSEVQASFQRTFVAEGSAMFPRWYDRAVAEVSETQRRQVVEALAEEIHNDGTIRWLQSLPAADRIADWGFFHGGPPVGFDGSIADLNARVQALIRAGEWQDVLIEPYRSQQSAIAARNWAGEETEVADLLSTFRLERVAFGHSPGSLNGLFGRLAQRWCRVFKADSYVSLGTVGYLEILDNSVWAVYSPSTIPLYHQLHPDSPELPVTECLCELRF